MGKEDGKTTIRCRNDVLSLFPLCIHKNILLQDSIVRISELDEQSAACKALQEVNSLVKMENGKNRG